MLPELERRFPILERLQDSFDPMSVEDVCALESELDATFPTDYVSFLLQYNAARMQHPIEFPVRKPGPFVRGGSLENCLGIIKESPECRTGSNIRSSVKAYRQRIPAGTLPIADTGGHPICLGIAGDSYGKVYLWDSIDEGADDNTYLVADSFTEFLGCLRPGDESYEYVEKLPIFQAVERGHLSDVKTYLAEGGKVDCRNEEGETL
jgi:hypothetical protein